MTPKEVKFAIGQIECPITHKIISKYIKELERILAEKPKQSINMRSNTK